MREQLIKLLEKARDDGMETCGSMKNGFGAWYADHLIANGAIIPIRCKDCKFWSDGVPGCTDHVKICKIGFYMVGENGYCVYGERKDDAEDQTST